MINEAGELSRIRDYLFKELAEKTGQPIDKVHTYLSHEPKSNTSFSLLCQNSFLLYLNHAAQIHEDFRRTMHFSAQSAIEYGLIDRIVRPQRIKPQPPRQSEGLG